MEPLCETSRIGSFRCPAAVTPSSTEVLDHFSFRINQTDTSQLVSIFAMTDNQATIARINSMLRILHFTRQLDSPIENSDRSIFLDEFVSCFTTSCENMMQTGHRQCHTATPDRPRDSCCLIQSELIYVGSIPLADIKQSAMSCDVVWITQWFHSE